MLSQVYEQAVNVAHQQPILLLSILRVYMLECVIHCLLVDSAPEAENMFGYFSG